MLASFRSARYTLLMSPNKDETAVHGYGLSLSVPVVLMSRKANFSTKYHPCSYVLYVGSFLAD